MKLQKKKRILQGKATITTPKMSMALKYVGNGQLLIAVIVMYNLYLFAINY